MKLQQGDIILKSIDEIPRKAKKVNKSDKGFIIQHGKVTGHSHRIEDNVELYEHNDTKYLKTLNPIELKHEEHKPLIIPPGKYMITRIMQYDPFEAEEQYVAD